MQVMKISHLRILGFLLLNVKVQNDLNGCVKDADGSKVLPFYFGFFFEMWALTGKNTRIRIDQNE